MYPSLKFSKVMDKFLVSTTKSNESNINSEERGSKLTHVEINLLLISHHVQFATFCSEIIVQTFTKLVLPALDVECPITPSHAFVTIQN